MEIVRCKNGHFYDSTENKTCPLCEAENNGTRKFENILQTEAFYPDSGTPNGMGAPGTTMPVDVNGGAAQQYPNTIPVSAYPKTEPVPIFGGADCAEPAGFNPVVGWLVCISGPSKGNDYRIHSQYNYIGRSAKMDISIPEDPYISTEYSAKIAYDDVNHIYYFGPGSGHNAVRVNGEMIINSATLKAYDVITVGRTELLFVPLCGDRFNWNETK